MGMRRTARHHDTVAVRRQAVVSEDYAEHRPGDRVITIDGPGRVVAVHDGPYPGSEEYEIRLEGGLGGGTYDAGQITASAPVEASVGQSEAAGIHLASDDYPELGTLLHDRPDPAHLRYTAAHIAMPSRRYPNHPAGFDTDIDGDESRNYLNGYINGEPVGEIEYSAYDPVGSPVNAQHEPNNVFALEVHGLGVDHEWQGRGVASALMDHLYTKHPNAWINHGTRTVEGDNWWRSYQEPDPDRNIQNVPSYKWDRYFDPAEVTSGTSGHRTASLEYQDGPDGGLSVTPAAPIVDDDGEGQVMRDMGQYHSDPMGMDSQHTARDINGEHIDDHGSAPEWHRAANPNAYDRQSTEGEPDPAWIDQIDRRQQAMAVRKTADSEHVEEHDEITDPDELAQHMLEHHGWSEHILATDPDELAEDHRSDHKDQPVSMGHHHGDIWPDEHWCEVHQTHHDDPQEASDHLHDSSHTDWDQYDLPDEIHRGMSVRLPDAVHSIVHDDSRPTHERANLLLHHLKGGMGVGMHWTTDHAQANSFSEYGQEPGESPRHERTRVLLTARTPGREHIETDPSKLDGAFHFEHDEKEIPLQRGVPLHLTGISWNDKPKIEHDHVSGKTTYNPVTHHDFTEPQEFPVQDPLFHATSSLPRVADLGPADLGREMDKFRDHMEERHQDDARFAVNWEPLHKSDLKPEEHDGWMFMEHRSQPMLLGHEDAFNKNTLHVDVDPTPMELTTYKHGITRKPLYLDSEGKSWQSLGMIEKGGQRHEVIDRFPGSATNHLRRSGHYDDLEQMGAAPETKYNTDYQLQRNKRLNDAGFDVVSHKIVGPSPEDPAEIAKHLVEQHGYTHDQLHNLGESGQGDELAAEHELEHNASTYEDGVGGGEFGNGEQGGGVEHKHGPAYEEFSTIPHLEHPIWGGAYNPEPGAAENAVTESMPAGVHPGDVPRHPWALSMLVTAAQDPSFRFHVTAAWRDVQAKAKRIRSQGGVSIKHSDSMTVVADVKGDHNVYETALQRAPGRRQSVAVYACGCKWGAYHWGASDDLSRFAGRMCSHALALQYEAASRGMFGRDVEVDDAKPRWVPSKVVVKYDIDTGQHLRATASVVPEQPPILVALASMRDGDPAAHVITAAVNDMFGDTSGYTEPSLMNPMGPTAPWNPDESPASAGPLSGGEPYNWGRINGPTMLPRIASVITTEAFWQAIVPLVRAVAPKVIKSVAPKVITHEVKKHQQKPVQEAQVPDGTEYGSQATLNDEPEGALPETDGDDHTASLGDVDIVNDDISTLGDDALSPESPSIQTQGGTADIVAAFQRSAAAQALMAGAPAGDTSSADIAQAAQAYLAKTAASAFTRAEQDELINESPGVQASNTDRLDIAGTHYAELDARDEEGDDLLWMM